MPTLLENLMLEEVSLVDKGASIGAHITLFKRDNSQGEPMEDEIEKMTDDQKAEMENMSGDMKSKMKMYMDKGMGYEKAKAMCNEDMKKSLEEEVAKLKADNEALRKSFLDEGYKITAEGVEKKAPEEFIEIEGEQINKADIPAPILKRLEEAEIEKAEAAISKRCKEVLPNLEEANARALLKAHDEMAEEEAKKFAEFMQALDNLFDEMTEEVGKSAAEGDMEDPNEKLNTLAKAYASEHDTTFAKAYALVVKTDEGKALIKKAYQKD
jgi:hypothetical protein